MPLHSLQTLPGGTLLACWHLTETPAALWPQLADAAAYAPLLPARAAGPRQAQWLAGRVLVQRALAAWHPIGASPSPLLHNDATGRPYLAGPGPVPAVSLSHAGEWVVALLGAAGQAVGLDIETVRDKAQRIKAKFLSSVELTAAELAAAVAPDPAAPYSLLWSAKETLYKLAGRPGLIFRENLLLDLPAGPWPASGQLPARLRLDGVETRHHICYTAFAPGYVLTYCVA